MIHECEEGDLRKVAQEAHKVLKETGGLVVTENDCRPVTQGDNHVAPHPARAGGEEETS